MSGKRWQAFHIPRGAADAHESPDLDDADHPTIRGLRDTGIFATVEQGHEVDQIANDTGMSHQKVEHYIRFRDLTKVGADGRGRLQIVGKGG